MADAPKISKTTLKAADRYVARMQRGERVMRDANGRLQWADGRPVAERPVKLLLEEGRIAELDTDLFGDSHRGQTIGLAS